MTTEEQAEARRLVRLWRSGEKDDAPKTAAVPRAAPPSLSADQPPPRAIREAQALMTALGYKPGPADGRWGPRTGRAYAAFQRDAGLPPGNVLTPDALRAMRGAAKGRKVAAAAAPPRSVPGTQRKSAPPPADLHRVVAAGDVDGLKAALAGRANANARDGKGWTALMRAADKGYALMVPPLLKAGADPNLRLADGATALFIAALHGHGEILAKLVDAGASLRSRGPRGRTVIDVINSKYGGYYRARDRGVDRGVLSIFRAGITAADAVDFIRKKLDECGTYKGIWYGGTAYRRHSVELVSNNIIKLSTYVTNLAHAPMKGSSAKLHWDGISRVEISRKHNSMGILHYAPGDRRNTYARYQFVFCNRTGLHEIAAALTKCHDEKRNQCRTDLSVTDDKAEDTLYKRVR